MRERGSPGVSDPLTKFGGQMQLTLHGMDGVTGTVHREKLGAKGRAAGTAAGPAPRAFDGWTSQSQSGPH